MIKFCPIHPIKYTKAKDNKNISLKFGLGLFGSVINPKYKKYLKTRSKSVSYKMSVTWEIKI